MNFDTPVTVVVGYPGGKENSGYEVVFTLVKSIDWSFGEGRVALTRTDDTITLINNNFHYIEIKKNV